MSIELGSKQIRANLAYNYFTIHIQSEDKRYLMFLPDNMINKSGYLPKVSHKIEVDGMLGKSNDCLYDGVIKFVKTIRHIQ